MSNTNFHDYPLSEEIVRALNHLGYNQPTDVQQAVIPLALQNKDLTVKAQTGSGKTAAFGIPICEMVNWNENKPQALILTPTRELADQVKADITNIGRYKRLKATAVYGKSPFPRQVAELKQKSHVVVGTPGRLLDHIEKGSIQLDQIRFLVIDEADEMLNMGFIDQVETIIQALPINRTTMLFSATLPKDVEKLCHRYMQNPLDVVVREDSKRNDQIDHSLFMVKEEEKDNLLRDVTIVENPDSCIIFVRTQERVDSLYELLDRFGYTCEKIHGGMVQTDRFRVMNAFKSGEFRYLVATDVAARGIDIENITHVINYDIPLEKESYVHRSGRTGRAGHAGKAITFATINETKFIEAIEDYLGFPIRRREVPSRADITKAKAAFEQKMDKQPTRKKSKNDLLNKGIIKLYFNGGKKKKLRAVDFVGTIAKLEGVSAEDIGIITIQDNVSYVEILNGKGQLVLQAMKHTTIKGKQLKVHRAIK